MKHFISILAVILMFSSGLMMDAQETVKPTKGLTVTIMIFSGRPNPTFTIKDESIISHISGTLSKMPNTEKCNGLTLSPSILGYQGILVENTSDMMPEIESFIVRHANVELKNKNATQNILDDFAAELEDYLIQLAQEQGVLDQNLVNVIKTQK